MDGSVRGSVFAYKSELDRWTDEILHEEESPPSVTSRLRSAKNLIIISALVAIFVVAVAVVVLRIGRSNPARASASANLTLAILPFTNNTGDESLDFWRNALADLLVSDLSQSRYLNVLSRDRVFLVLRDLGQLDAENDNAIDLTKVAARTKVENIVVGNFIKTGQRFRVSATVRHIPTGDSVVLPTVEARNENEILVRIDELSASIKNHLVRPLDRTGRDLDLDIGTITTSSLEAYRHFSEGRSSWYEGRAIDAAESFEKAVTIDPEFATAYDWLTVAYFYLPGHQDKVEESITRAFELSHHVSPRERFIIHNRYYLIQGRRSWGKALETIEEFAKAYPDDYDAARRLANFYLRLEEWEKCIEACENISNPQGLSSHVSALRQAHCALGQYEAALEVAKESASTFHYRHQLALNLIYQRSFEAALLEADAMLESAPGHASALKVKGDVHFLRAEWDQAEDYYRELLDPVAREQSRLGLRLEGVRRMAQLYRAKGQFGQAVDVLTQAIDEVTALGEWRWLVSLHYPKAEILLAQGDLSAANAEIEITLAAAERMNHVSGLIGCLHLRGMILLEQGDLRGAQRAADQMKTEIEGWVRPKLMGTWYRLAGHIDLARNDVGQAVERFEQAVSLLPYQHDPDGDGHAFYYSPLAFAHYLAGDMAKAQEWYENILALTTGRLNDGEFYAESHFMLGKIHEQQGSTAEAVRYYRTFLDLWREADSTAPDIEEAKRALANLLG